MQISCAQCENAAATLWCKDENLHYCEQCSGLLHTKKARMHHRVESVKAAPICDECEVATGEVECLECGGNTRPLVFCKACSLNLHSRVARRDHCVIAVSSVERKGEVDNPVTGRDVIDLTAIDSDEENKAPCSSSAERLPNAASALKEGPPVKQEKLSPNAEEAARNDASRLNCLNGRVKGEADEERAVPASTGRKRGAPGNEEPERRRKVEKSGKLKAKARVKEEGCELNKPTGEERKRPKLGRKPPNGRTCKAEPASLASDTIGTEPEGDGVHYIKRGAVSLEAFLVDAPDTGEDAGPSDPFPESNVESGIKNKIKNMLDLGLHPDTPEFEAQQALRNAQRLLTKYNLEQVEVMGGNLKDASSLTGGMRMVELRPRGRVKHGRMEFWIMELSDVIRLNFDCQYFFKSATAVHPLRIVFYGIRQNANCAGYAFAATFNRITVMSAAYVPDDDSETKHASVTAANRRTEMRVARANYRNGVVAGLRVALKKSPRQDNEGAAGCKTPQAPAAEAGVGAGAGEEAEVGAVGHDDFMCRSDNEADMDDTAKESTSPEECHPSPAISALVLHSKLVGEEFLKQKGIKIRIRTKRSRTSAWNAEAYEQGKIDSETIDINQRSITGGKGSRSAKEEI